jgi:hypothetical protein
METPTENRETKLLNPCLVVKVNEKLFQDHDTTFAKEDWVKANDILMAQDGVEYWLRAFLATLSGSFRKSLASPVSPYHAITLVRPADTARTISADRWVNDNLTLVGQLGRNSWLWAMLDMLESGIATRQS